MAPTSPSPKKKSFRAFNTQGHQPHLIPNVTRIDSHRLRGGEWPQTRSKRRLEQDVMDELTAKTLHCPSPTIQCEYCLLPGSSPLCTPECYSSFRLAHLSHPLIELRGPGPLGYGAFVRRGIKIKKGQWIGEYIGELRPIKRVNRELEQRGKQSLYRFDIPTELPQGEDGEGEGKVGETVVVDSEWEGNWTRFVNSDCVGNLGVWASFLGKRHVLLFRAKRNIAEGEELTFAYGRGYFEAAGILCGCSAREGLHEVGNRRNRGKKGRKRAIEEVEEGDVGE